MFDRTAYRADIDGLRAVAVIAVVAYHAFPAMLPFGFLGVDTFFVISGFLITGVITTEISSGRFSPTHFYARRIRRLFPALVTVLIASFVLGWSIMLPKEFEQFGAHLVGAALFLSNFQFWREAGYFDKAAEFKPLLHLWSLSVEEQFYLVWPLLLILCRRFWLPTWIIAIAIASISFGAYIVVVQQSPNAAFYLPVTRFWELMLGALLALNRVKPNFATSAHGVLAGTSLALLAVCFDGIFGNVFGQSVLRILTVLGSCGLVASGGGNSVSRTFLSNRLAIGIGLVSYPLYLWHWPLLSFLRVASIGEATAWTRLLVVGLSLILAAATYFLVECPFRFGRWKSVAVPILGVGFLATGVSGAAVFLLNGIPMRLAEPIRSVVTAETDWAKGARVGRCWLSGSAPSDAFSQECSPPPTKDRKSAWLWGDSHAARLYVGMQSIFGNDFQVGQLTRDACPPLVHFGYDNCQASNDFALSLIKKYHPSMVILFARWAIYLGNDKAQLSASLAETISRLKAASVGAILVIGPAPDWSEPLPKLLTRYWREDVPLHRIPDKMAFGLDRDEFETDSDMERWTVAMGARFVSLLKIMCHGGACMTIVPSATVQLTTTDQGHLTAAAAQYVFRSAAMSQALAGLNRH